FPYPTLFRSSSFEYLSSRSSDFLLTLVSYSGGGRMRTLFKNLAILLLTACTTTPPAPPKTVNVIVFPGGFNWPIWVAEEKGFFANNALDVKVTPTPSSVFQLTNLIEGKFDIAMTAIDNLIAYREGQGEAK